MIVLDWDDIGTGDPIFDVAYLLAWLDAHEAPLRAAEAGHAFLAGYGPLGPGAEERLPVYRVFNLVRRACRRYRLRDPGWESEAERMLDRLEPALEAVPEG